MLRLDLVQEVVSCVQKLDRPSPLQQGLAWWSCTDGRLEVSRISQKNYGWGVESPEFARRRMIRYRISRISPGEDCWGIYSPESARERIAGVQSLQNQPGE